MADDLGFETLGCNGGESYQTPRLDQLAKEGMRFENCFSTPLCTPSRVQIMTGKYNFRNYIGFGLLDSNEKTFGHYFQEAGYKTCIAGKWQLYGNARQQELAGGRTGTLPKDAGFDQYCLWQVKDRGTRYKNPTVEIEGKGLQTYEDGYGPDVFVDYIESFIEENKNQPFFVYFPMCLTHDPFVPTPNSAEFDGFDSQSKTNDPQYFGEMVNYMDQSVGRLVDKINALGLGENTLVLFIGDNGTDRDVTSQWKGKSIKGNKGFTTDAGTHVPFIASWPGTIEAGSINPNLIDFTDFLPSLLDISGQKEIKKKIQIDGKSFYPQLLGRKGKGREWVFCHYDPNWGKFEPGRYVQNTKWKLYDSGEIYNLEVDPEEKNPLSKSELPPKGKSVISEFEQVLEKLQ